MENCEPVLTGNTHILGLLHKSPYLAYEKHATVCLIWLRHMGVYGNILPRWRYLSHQCESCSADIFRKVLPVTNSVFLIFNLKLTTPAFCGYTPLGFTIGALVDGISAKWFGSKTPPGSSHGEGEKSVCKGRTMATSRHLSSVENNGNLRIAFIATP